MDKRKVKQTGREPYQKMRVGTNIIKHLSTTFYPKPHIIFDELVSNSRDAMARTVKMNIGEGEITIEDNGEGMSKEELVHFFYISHTTKLDKPVRTLRRIKREIIGKFGIGKLSLYQICTSFEIITWRNGVESRAVFDFSEFEKEKFIDNFSLKVISESKRGARSGTRIILKDLKKKISAKEIKRHLTRTMPLTKDFKIVIGGVGLDKPVELKSEDVLAGNISGSYIINEFVEGVGKVEGQIAYKKTESKEFGVYVKVLGRLVNLDNPHSIVNFSSLTHARTFARKIYAELNADGLNEALQTNRSGFMTEHEAYKSFKSWLKTKLNRLNKKEIEKWNELRKSIEADEIKEVVSSLLPRKENLSKSSTSPRRGIKTAASRSKRRSSLPIEQKEKNLILMRGKEFEIEVEPIGEDAPEAVLDKRRSKIIINSINPLYDMARKKGGVWGVQYHALRASIVIFALEMSRSLDDFKDNYNKLVKESEEIVDNMKRRVVINRV